MVHVINTVGAEAIVGFLCAEKSSGGLTTESQAEAFLRKVHEGQRLGQAFMNVIDEMLYLRLTASPFDPFHKNDSLSVIRAIEWYTS